MTLIRAGAANQTAVTNNILEEVSDSFGTRCENFNRATVQVNSTGTGGTFIFEQSNDAVNWTALPVLVSASGTGSPITSAITATASVTVYSMAVRCRFIRLRIVTTITGGSIQAFTLFGEEPWVPVIQTVAQANGANLNVTLAAGAAAAGGASIHHVVAAASTNAAQIKASAGRVLGWSLSNNTASWRYVKLHNVASPTAGAAVAMTIGIPPNGYAPCELITGISFTTAIGRTIVTGAPDADATATAANDVVGDIFFA